jgi:hypothetical protein
MMLFRLLFSVQFGQSGPPGEEKRDERDLSMRAVYERRPRLFLAPPRGGLAILDPRLL